MDRRLLLELLPGVAFLIAYAATDLLWAAFASASATVVAVWLRWRWDKTVPLLALATLAIVIILTCLGFIFDNETFVMVRPTVGGLAFAAFVMAGAFARPSALERALGYRLCLYRSGWFWLHGAWAAILALSAGANEVARRVLSEEGWVIYGFVSDFAAFGLIWVATYGIAELFWDEEEEEARAEAEA